MADCKDLGINPDKVPCFVDVDCSDGGWRSWRASESMTLTATRCKMGGWYVSTLKRRLDMEEMLRFQGWSKHFMGDMGALADGQILHAVGNAMSCNVLERLLPRLAYVTGVVKEKPLDAWKSKSFVLKGARFASITDR